MKDVCYGQMKSLQKNAPHHFIIIVIVVILLLLATRVNSVPQESDCTGTDSIFECLANKSR